MANSIEWQAPDGTQAARQIQETLRGRVIPEGSPEKVRLVAGLDAHYRKNSRLVWGAAALLDWPDLQLVESALACRPLDFPYVPGLLSFREAPALLAVLGCLSRRPDLLFVDGQGIAHPRRMGIASHVGVLADIPTIGAAKSRLIGSFEPPGAGKGAWSPLNDRNEVIGAVVRTREGVRPLFVSIGHRICLDAAVRFVLEASCGYRMPEPTRLADKISRMHCG